MSVAKEFIPLRIAVLTVSDSRTLAEDTSGQYLADQLQAAGHTLGPRELIADNRYELRARLSTWIVDADIQVVLISGGTGLTGRDLTPEAIQPLFDRTIEGFGELFRQLSYADIGSSTVQSRALGGMANGTLIFALPGSTGACRLAWESILEKQLDVRQKPCNFVSLMPRFKE